VAAVPAVHPVYRLHEAHPPFIVDPVRQALLPLRVRHDVGEEHARLVVDEPALEDAFQ
jgi:hypothetical protein